jgi:hypothetical protein
MKKKSWKKGVILMIIILLVVLLVAVFALLLASGAFTKAVYNEPWEKSYAQTFEDPRTQLAALGLLAPSGHNMQPWNIQLDQDPNVFYLYADAARLTPEVDPYARQTMVTQGAFLEYVSVAGEQLGYQTDIVLFPNGEYDEGNLLESMKAMPVAKITLTKADATPSGLYDALFLPDTNRAPYQDMPLTADQIARLKSINSDPDLQLLVFDDDANRTTLGNIAIEGAKIESGIHRINDESGEIFRANEREKNAYRYGYSVEGQGTTGFMKHVMQGLITLFPAMNNEAASADLFIKSTQDAVAHTPAYAMIITNGNSRTEQVKSGMLYSKLVLTAHTFGIVMQPPSQALEEYPEMSALYAQIHADYAPDGGTIQMFVRMGFATKSFPNSMRRDVTELLLP